MLIEKLQFNTIHSILTSESPGNLISMKSRLLTSVPSGTVIVKATVSFFWAYSERLWNLIAVSGNSRDWAGF